VYYSFHDNNILYDGRYANVSEYTKDIEDRIQHNTPQPKTVASRVTRDSNARRIYEPSLSLASGINRAHALATVEQMNEQKLFLSTDPIGSCSPTTDKAPSWSVKVLNGEISGSVPHFTSSYQTLRIPQIDVDLVYKTSVFHTDAASSLPITPDPVLNSSVYSDGSYVVVDPDHLLLEVIENNTEYKRANIEVEVYEIIEEDMTSAKSGLSGNRNTKELLEPLFFEKEVNLVQNNILFDRSELAPTETVELNDKMVNYYFNVLVDREIDTAELCEAQSSFETKNLYVDLDICCPDAQPSSRYDMYTGPVVTTPAIEDTHSDKCSE
jgi:hypothetical protein